MDEKSNRTHKAIRTWHD